MSESEDDPTARWLAVRFGKLVDHVRKTDPQLAYILAVLGEDLLEVWMELEDLPEDALDVNQDDVSIREPK